MTHERTNLPDDEIQRLIAKIFPELIKAITLYCIENYQAVSNTPRIPEKDVLLTTMLEGRANPQTLKDTQTLLTSNAFEEWAKSEHNLRTPTKDNATPGDFISLMAHHINGLIVDNNIYSKIKAVTKKPSPITLISIANWYPSHLNTVLELLKIALSDNNVSNAVHHSPLTYDQLITPLINIFNTVASSKEMTKAYLNPDVVKARMPHVDNPLASVDTNPGALIPQDERDSKAALSQTSSHPTDIVDALMQLAGQHARDSFYISSKKQAASESSQQARLAEAEAEQDKLIGTRFEAMAYVSPARRSDNTVSMFATNNFSRNEAKNLQQSQRGIYEDCSLFGFQPCSNTEQTTLNNIAPQAAWEIQGCPPNRDVWGADGSSKTKLNEILAQLDTATATFNGNKDLGGLIQATIGQLWEIEEWKELLKEKKINEENEDVEILDLPLVKGAIARLLKAITSNQNTPPILQVLQPTILEALYRYLENINTHNDLNSLNDAQLETAITKVISLPAPQQNAPGAAAGESKEADEEMDNGAALATAATAFIKAVTQPGGNIVQQWHQASAPLHEKGNEPQLLLRPPIMKEELPSAEGQLRKHARAQVALELANIPDIIDIDFESQVSEIVIVQQRLEAIVQVLMANKKALIDILKENALNQETDTAEYFLFGFAKSGGWADNTLEVLQRLRDRPQHHQAIIQIINGNWSKLTSPFDDEANLQRCQALLLSPKKTTIERTNDALKKNGKKTTSEVFVLIAQQAFLEDGIADKINALSLSKDRAAVLKNYVLQLAQECFKDSVPHQEIFANCLLNIIEPFCNDKQLEANQANLGIHANKIALTYDIETSMLEGGSNYEPLRLLNISPNYGDSNLPDITAGKSKDRKQAAIVLFNDPSRAEEIIKKHRAQIQKIVVASGMLEDPLRLNEEERANATCELNAAIDLFEKNIDAYRENPEGFINEEILPALRQKYLLDQPWADAKVKTYELIRQPLPTALDAIAGNREDIALPALDIRAVSQQLQMQLAITILFAHKGYFLNSPQTHADLKAALENNESAVYEFLIQYSGATTSVIKYYRENKEEIRKGDEATIGELLSRECTIHQTTNNYTSLAGSFARWQVLAHNNEAQAEKIANDAGVALHPPFVIAEDFPTLVTTCPGLMDFPGAEGEAELAKWVDSRVNAFKDFFKGLLDNEEYKTFIRTKALNENISFDQAHKNVCSNYLNGVFSQLTTVTDIRSNLKETLAETVINGTTTEIISNGDGIVLDLGEGTSGDKLYYKPIAALYIYPKFFTTEVYERLGIPAEDQAKIKEIISKPPKQAFVELMAYLKQNEGLSDKISDKISENYEITYPCYNHGRGAAFLKFFFNAASNSLTSNNHVTRLLDAGSAGTIIRPITLSFDPLNKLLADLDGGKPFDFAILTLLKKVFIETIDTVLSLASNEELTRMLEPFPEQDPLKIISSMFVSLMPGFISESYGMDEKEFSLGSLLGDFFQNFNKKYITGQTKSVDNYFIQNSPDLNEYKRYFSEKIDQLVRHTKQHSGRLIPSMLTADQSEFLTGLSGEGTELFMNNEENSHGSFFENSLIYNLNQFNVEPETKTKQVMVNKRNTSETHGVKGAMGSEHVNKNANGYIGFCKNLSSRGIYNLISKKCFQGAPNELMPEPSPADTTNPVIINEIESLFANNGPLSLNGKVDYYSARVYLEFVLVPKLNSLELNTKDATLASDINALLEQLDIDLKPPVIDPENPDKVLKQPDTKKLLKNFIEKANKFIGRAYKENILGPAPAYIEKLYLEQQKALAIEKQGSSSRAANMSQASNGPSASSNLSRQASRTSITSSSGNLGEARPPSTDPVKAPNKTESGICQSFYITTPEGIALPNEITSAFGTYNVQQVGIQAQAYLDKNYLIISTNEKLKKHLVALAIFQHCYPGHNPQPVFAKFLTATIQWPAFLGRANDQATQLKLPTGIIGNAFLYKAARLLLEIYNLANHQITFKQHCVNAIDEIIKANELTADGQELSWFLDGVQAPSELSPIAKGQDPRNIINAYISNILGQLNSVPTRPQLTHEQTIKIIGLIGATLANQYLEGKQKKKAIAYYKDPQKLLALANTNFDDTQGYTGHNYADYRILSKFINPEVTQKIPAISTQINADNFITETSDFSVINAELTDKARYFLPILQRLLNHGYFSEHGNEKTKFIKHYFETLKVLPQAEKDFKCNFMLDILSSYFSSNVGALSTMEVTYFPAWIIAPQTYEEYKNEKNIAQTALGTSEPEEVERHFKQHWVTAKANRPTSRTVEGLKLGIKNQTPVTAEKISDALTLGKKGLLLAFWKTFITSEITENFIGKNIYVIADFLLDSFQHCCDNYIQTLEPAEQKIFIEDFSNIFYYIAGSATQAPLTSKQVGLRYDSYINNSSAAESRDYEGARIEIAFARDATKPVPVDAKTLANIVAMAITKIIESGQNLSEENVQKALPIAKFKLADGASKPEYFAELYRQVSASFEIYGRKYPPQKEDDDSTNRTLLRNIGDALFDHCQGNKPQAATSPRISWGEIPIHRTTNVLIRNDNVNLISPDQAEHDQQKTITAMKHSLANGWTDAAVKGYMKTLEAAAEQQAAETSDAAGDQAPSTANDLKTQFRTAAATLVTHIQAKCLAKIRGGISFYGSPPAKGMREIIKALSNKTLTPEQIVILTQAFSAARLNVTRGCLSGPREPETLKIYEALKKIKTSSEFIAAVNDLNQQPPTNTSASGASPSPSGEES
jgi:hypothetical protein